MKTGKELKPGTVIRLENDPWLVQKAEFTKSGRNSAIMKTKLKNLLTGYKTEIVYSADDKLDDVILDRKEATLSFISGDTYTFMDTTDYTMYELNAEDIEAVLPFVEEGMTDVCEAIFFEDRLVSVELPTTIVRKVAYTEGSARGDTSGKVMKPAKLANGTELQAYIDVATGSVGVRAHLVSGVDQALCVVLIQARQADVQVDVQAETAGDLTDANVGSDRSVIRDLAFGLAGHEFQRADEAGRVAGGEQLLRVGGLATCATQFLGGREFDVEDVVAGNGATITAAGCGSYCCVESLHGVVLLGV
ncbi:hypothetical protein BHE74_00011691 [Ensete ventricosum]|nr:hypothetical protein BHE74_00011691 [Ensete ventricosum]